MFTRGSENCINKLRIVGEVDDSLVFQLRLQSLLSSMDFSIPGVPPASVVCIRSVADPRPRTLRLVRSELAGADTWSRSLTQALVNKVSRAARPATGLVPSNAECVLFADKAEMLAAVAGDWLSGLLWTRWWWKTLLRTGDTPANIKQLWRDHPQYVPAALDQLGRQYKAASFVNALTENECHEMIQQVVHVFAMHELLSICATPIVIEAKTDSEIVSHAPARVTADASTAELVPGPWAPWCSETTSRDLSLERQRFLGIALIMQRAPAQARSRAFAQSVERWQQIVARRVQDHRDGVNALAHAEEQVESRSESSTDSAKVSSIQPEQHTARGSKEVSDAQPAVIHDGEARHSQSESFGNESFSTVATSDRPLHDSIGTKVLSPTLDSAGSIADVRESEREVLGLTQPDLVTSVSLDDGVEAASVEIETQLGGLFYLINLALYLNLYGDFTMPTAPGIELNIWDFVALVGAELAGDAVEEDPIWLLLVNLAGRKEEEPLGSSFEPDDEWRLPPEWLSMFSDDRPWRWNSLGTQASRPAKHARGVRTQKHARGVRTQKHARGVGTQTRLRVLHPAGFLILDLPLAQDVREQLQREIKPYDVSERSLSRGGIPKLSPLRSKLAAPPEVRRWLSLLMPYARARLRLALGLESDQDIATMLCQRYARVRATDTHIDVFFRLADLPLGIRFAGLDRDPGWVPAAGRFISFHFD